MNTEYPRLKFEKIKHIGEKQLPQDYLIFQQQFKRGTNIYKADQFQLRVKRTIYTKIKQCKVMEAQAPFA